MEDSVIFLNLREMDKINVLPDELLVKILSLLPTNVAVSTSILSKRWKFLWMWLPKLDYTTSDPKPGLEGFINKNLPLHRAPVIESLRLDFSNLDVRPEEIRLWIEIAVSRHVHELECSYFWSYKTIFPSSLFTCNSLVTLNLRDMFLADVPSMACLPSLKTLQLKGVIFVDEGFVQKLLSICPVLEDLSVFFYDGGEYINMKKFTITVPSLQSLSLLIPEDWYLDGYVIDTPSLKYFKLVDWNDMYHYSSIKNMPKLKEAYVEVEFCLLKSVIESITSVKRLTICSEGMYGDGFVFKQLEHLSLCVCKDNSSNLLAQLLKDSPNLRVLNISVFENHRSKELDGMVCWIQPSPVPECLLLSLQILNWSQYFGRPQDKDILVYILKNACYLKTTTVLADGEEDYVSVL